jgi:hypothetical protein
MEEMLLRDIGHKVDPVFKKLLRETLATRWTQIWRGIWWGFHVDSGKHI